MADAARALIRAAETGVERRDGGGRQHALHLEPALLRHPDLLPKAQDHSHTQSAGPAGHRPDGPRSHDRVEPQSLFRRSRSQLEPQPAGRDRHLVEIARHRAARTRPSTMEFLPCWTNRSPFAGAIR
ncbi:MAG: hypothetical protein MZV70_03720 [Desulfobacterales bacterium]|nr:hypothetical protein [Desulfobacterales bacterium]